MEPHRYAQNWRMIAVQLATLVSDRDARLAGDLLDQEGIGVVWRGATGEDWNDTADWLGLPPARLVKKWAKVPDEVRPILALRLQYLAHLSANAAETAEHIVWAPDDSRKALRSTARHLLERPTIPSVEQLQDCLLG